MAQRLKIESHRRNLNIAADAYAIASTYASARGISISRAVSELVRRAEHAPEPPSPLLKTDDYGLLVKARADRGRVTSAMVKKLSEDDSLD